MNIYQKINTGHYENPIPYPHKPKHPKLKTTNPTAEEISEYQAAVVVYSTEIAEYENYNKKYTEESQKINKQFREDLRTEFGTTNLPNEDVLYSEAYDKGHSGGLYEVASHYSNLVEFLEKMGLI